MKRLILIFVLSCYGLLFGLEYTLSNSTFTDMYLYKYFIISNVGYTGIDIYINENGTYIKHKGMSSACYLINDKGVIIEIKEYPSTAKRISIYNIETVGQKVKRQFPDAVFLSEEMKQYYDRIFTNDYNISPYTVTGITRKGCKDTDNVVLRISIKGEIIANIVGLGNVKIALFDFDSDKKEELFILSTFECQGIEEIYVLKEK